LVAKAFLDLKKKIFYIMISAIVSEQWIWKIFLQIYFDFLVPKRDAIYRGGTTKSFLRFLNEFLLYQVDFFFSEDAPWSEVFLTDFGRSRV
jgi:hypothetical protein